MDSRKEALTSAREKAVKAQTLFENLNRQCDDKIKVMEGMLANGSGVNNRQSGEKRKLSDNNDNTKDEQKLQPENWKGAALWKSRI